MLSTMGKKSSKPLSEPVADRHKNPVASFRPSPQMRAVIQRLADADDRSFAYVVEKLLAEILTQKKLWPPPPADAP